MRIPRHLQQSVIEIAKQKSIEQYNQIGPDVPCRLCNKQAKLQYLDGRISGINLRYSQHKCSCGFVTVTSTTQHFNRMVFEYARKYNDN